MAPIPNGSAIFNKAPTGFPVLGETIVHKVEPIDLENVPLNGGTLVKTLYLSIDPHLRRFMQDGDVSTGSVFELGQPISGFAIASVLRSEKDNIHKGDIIYVPNCPFQEYTVLPADQAVRIVKPEAGVSLSAYLSILGMPGQTAFYGLETIGKPKPGETIYVSTGAGAVGSVVAQLAKAKGLKVIASAGSDDKVEFMKQIGVDVAFNYKTENVADVLTKQGPIDIYWDHVGGSTLEAAIAACNLYARIVVCGAITDYNNATPYPVMNLSEILFKRLRIQGFMVWEAEVEVEGGPNNPTKFLSTFVPLVKSGQLKWAEQVYEGIESVGAAIVDVQTGASTAKVVVKVADV